MAVWFSVTKCLHQNLEAVQWPEMLRFEIPKAAGKCCNQAVHYPPATAIVQPFWWWIAVHETLTPLSLRAASRYVLLKRGVNDFHVMFYCTVKMQCLLGLMLNLSISWIKPSVSLFRPEARNWTSEGYQCCCRWTCQLWGFGVRIKSWTDDAQEVTSLNQDSILLWTTGKSHPNHYFKFSVNFTE